ALLLAGAAVDLAVLAGARILGRAGAAATVGVSFYSLQAIGYLVDVRDEQVPAERHAGRFALSLAFFPRFIQGPIERAGRFLPQLREPLPMSWAQLAAGAQQLLWGFFQKLVVADRLAPFADAVFDDVHRWTGVPLVAGTWFFAAQIYLDFAGYTDMALGAARMLGIQLTPNF